MLLICKTTTSSFLETHEDVGAPSRGDLVVQNDDGGAGPRNFEGATPLRQDRGWDKGEGDMAPLVSRELFSMPSMQYSVLWAHGPVAF
jgi:hypothetical protein